MAHDTQELANSSSGANVICFQDQQHDAEMSRLISQSTDDFASGCAATSVFRDAHALFARIRPPMPTWEGELASLWSLEP